MRLRAAGSFPARPTSARWLFVRGFIHAEKRASVQEQQMQWKHAKKQKEQKQSAVSVRWLGWDALLGNGG